MIEFLINYPMVVDAAIALVFGAIGAKLVIDRNDNRRTKEALKRQQELIVNYVSAAYPATMSREECAEMNQARWN